MRFEYTFWKIWQGIILFICLCALILPIGSINKTGYFAIFIIIGSSFLSFKMKNRIKELADKKDVKTLLLGFFLTVLFLFMLPVSSLVKNNHFLNRTEFYSGVTVLADYLKSNILSKIGQSESFFYLFRCIFLTGLITNTFVFCILLLYPNNQSRECENADEPQKTVKVRSYHYIIPISIVAIIYMLSAIPLSAQSDYVSALTFVSNGVYFAGWPLAWTYLITLLQYIGGGFSIVVLQTIFFICVNDYVLGVIAQISGKSGCRVYMFAILFSTSPFVNLMIPYRDSFYSSAFLGLIATNFAIAYKRKKERKDYVFWFIFSAIVLLFRHEGLYVIIGSCIFQSIYEIHTHISTKKDCIVMTAALAATFLFFNKGIPLFCNLTIVETPYEYKYSIPLSNMAGIAAKNLPIDEEDVEIMEKIMPIEEWKAYYHPECVDTVSRVYGGVGQRIENLGKYNLGPEFLRLNAKYLIKYPEEYLQIYAKVTNIIWEIQPANYNEWEPVYARDPAMPEAYGYMMSNATEFTRLFSDMAYEMPIWHTFAFRGGIYIFIIVAGVITIFMRCRKWMSLFICMPIILSVGCLMLAIPVPASRYILNIMMSGILIFSIVFMAEEKIVNCKKGDI